MTKLTSLEFIKIQENVSRIVEINRENVAVIGFVGTLIQKVFFSFIQNIHTFVIYKKIAKYYECWALKLMFTQDRQRKTKKKWGHLYIQKWAEEQTLSS